MKPTTSHIVCGTDFTEHSAEAASVAAMLASKFNETLVLIHCRDQGTPAPNLAESRDVENGDLSRALHEEAERLRSLGPTIVIEELVAGSAREKLVEAGHLSTTRIVVVGSVGKAPTHRFGLGSVAEQTAEHSAAPTLVVRGSKAFEAWMQGERPLQVVLCYDFSTSAFAALKWIETLRGVGPCNVTVVYASWPPEESSRLGLPMHHSFNQNSPDIQKVLERELSRKVIEVLGTDNIQIRVLSTWGRPDVPLLELVGELKADLVVVGTHQRHGLDQLWLGSVSRAILRRCPCSVVMVPNCEKDVRAGLCVPVLKKALVTTDFSDLANSAIPHAYSVLPRGGIVCILHVMTNFGDGTENGLKLSMLRQQLQHLIPLDAEEHVIETEVEVVQHQDAATAICQAAERFGADLICMASHGRSGVAKSVLGSVAQSVMTHSTRPVLLLRPPSP